MMSTILAIIGENTQLGSYVTSSSFSIFVQSDLKEGNIFRYELQIVWLRVSILNMNLPFLKNIYLNNGNETYSELEELLFPPDPNLINTSSQTSSTQYTTMEESTESSTTAIDFSWLLDFPDRMVYRSLDEGSMSSMYGIFAACLAIIGVTIFAGTIYPLAPVVGLIANMILIGIGFTSAFVYLFWSGSKAAEDFIMLGILALYYFAITSIIEKYWDAITSWKALNPGKKRDIKNLLKAIGNLTDPKNEHSIILIALGIAAPIIEAIFGFGSGIGDYIKNEFIKDSFAVGLLNVLLLGFLTSTIFTQIVVIGKVKMLSDKDLGGTCFKIWKYLTLGLGFFSLIVGIIDMFVAYQPLTIGVIDKETKQPVQNAHVYVDFKDYPEYGFMNKTTNEDGLVRFGVEFDKVYNVRVVASGYHSNSSLWVHQFYNPLIPGRVPAYIIYLTPIDLELNVFVNDTKGNIVTYSPTTQNFALTRYDEVNEKWESIISNPGNDGNMRFPQNPAHYLIYDTDYNLTYDESFEISYEYLSETVTFKYYQYYSELLGEIPETSATNPKVVTLTPSTNTFKVRVIDDSFEKNPVGQADIILRQTDDQGQVIKMITGQTGDDGICTFQDNTNFLFDEYWQNWEITGSKSGESSIKSFKDAHFDWNFVKYPIILSI